MQEGLPLVYAVILAWNHKEDTLDCIASLERVTYPRLEILVVDNGSEDGTGKAIRARYPDVHQLRLPTNLGFAAGCNHGIADALQRGANQVLILNNDTLADPNLVDELVALTDETVGVVAPRIYYADDPHRLWSVGADQHPITLEMVGSRRNELDTDVWEPAVERQYLVGCALLLSRRLLETIGGFDERFFMYYEDMDLSLRARKAGFKLLLAPKAMLWHKVAATSGGSDSPNERYWMARSSVLFFAKHASPLQLLAIVPYRFGSLVKTVSRLVFCRRSEAAKAYLRGIRDSLAEVFSDRKVG